MPDRFPEAFERFEQVVDVDMFDSYMELTYAFREWAGEKWHGTHKQWEALNVEAEKLGFPVPYFIRGELRERKSSGYYVSEGRQNAVAWRHEVITVKGMSQSRYRDLNTGRFIRKPRG
jgi:hypothetical protein